MHVPTIDNIYDIITRSYYGPSASLPWVGHSVNLQQKNNKQVKHINIENLPESNTREIPSKQCTSVFLTLNPSRQLDATNHSQRTGLPLSGTLRSVTKQYPIPDLRQLLAVQLPLIRQHQAVGPCHPPHPATDEIMNLFSRAGTYHIAVNAIARILQWGSGEVFCDAQERAKNVIFNVFQMQRKEWCALFRGNGFKVKTKSCIYLIGRDTCYGPTEL